MVRPSIREFLTASNALLGGLGGYYLQTLYITYEQAEEVEAAWRRVYRLKFGRECSICQSTPRVFWLLHCPVLVSCQVSRVR